MPLIYDWYRFYLLFIKHCVIHFVELIGQIPPPTPTLSKMHSTYFKQTIQPWGKKRGTGIHFTLWMWNTKHLPFSTWSSTCKWCSLVNPCDYLIIHTEFIEKSFFCQKVGESIFIQQILNECLPYVRICQAHSRHWW